MAADETNLTETPAETGAESQAKPLQTSEEKALTSHLANVTLPAETEADEAQEIKDEANCKLPKTLKESLALLAEGQDYQPKNAFEAKVKAAKLEKLRDHIHALSQGAATPAILGTAHTELTAVHSDHAEEMHLTLLRRSDRIVDNRLKRDAETIADLRKQLAAALKK